MKFSKNKKQGKIERRLWKKLIEIAKLKADSECCEMDGCNNLADQTDHCFSASKCVMIRFDHRNLTRLCGKCHNWKTHCTYGYEKKVDEHVKRREGAKNWKELQKLAQKVDGFKWNVLLLEELEKEIDEHLENFRKRNIDL